MTHSTSSSHVRKEATVLQPVVDPTKLSSGQLQALIGSTLSSLSLAISQLTQSKMQNEQDQEEIEKEIAKMLSGDIDGLMKDLKSASDAENTLSHESGATKFFHKIANFFGDHYTTENDVKALQAKVQQDGDKLAGDIASALIKLDPKLTENQAKKLAGEIIKMLSDLDSLVLNALQQAVSSKGSATNKSQTENQTDNSGNLTDAQIRELISEALMLFAQFVGQLAKASAQNQQDESKIAKEIADQVHKDTMKFVEDLKELVQKQEEAHSGFLGAMSDVFGSTWGKILMGALCLLTCETGIGVLLVIGITALSATGTLDKMQNGLADQLGGGTWGQVGACAIIMGGTLAVGGLGEGLELSARQGAERGGAEAADASSSSLSARFPRYATIQAVLQEMTAGNFWYNFLVSCGAPKDSLGTMIGAMILNVFTCLAAMGGRAGLDKSKGVEIPGLAAKSVNGRLVMAAINTLFQGLQAAANINAGINQMEQGDKLKELASSQSQMELSSAFQPIINAYLDAMSKNYKSTVDSQTSIFKADLATGWEKGAQVAVEFAG